MNPVRYSVNVLPSVCIRSPVLFSLKVVCGLDGRACAIDGGLDGGGDAAARVNLAPQLSQNVASGNVATPHFEQYFWLSTSDFLK